VTDTNARSVLLEAVTPISLPLEPCLLKSHVQNPKHPLALAMGAQPCSLE
jgi:hypothetical protein